MKLRRRRRVKAFPQKRSQLCVGVGFCPQLGGVGPYPAQCIWQGSGFAADQTNAMLAVGGTSCISLVSVAAADENSLTPLHRLLPTETASLGFGGSPVGGGDKNSHVIFFAFLCGGYHYPPAALSVSEQLGAGFISAEKAAFSEWVLCADERAVPSCTQRFFGTSMRGGYHITLGVRFMPLKRWTPAGHGGVFAVFMPPQCSPCAG